MKHFLIISTILLLLSPTAAFASSSFVIEANGAQPDIGIQVQGDTQITIDDGGHIVLMTDAGQMIRQDGPFSGTADDILSDRVGSSDTAMEGGLLGSLLELDVVSGISDEQLGAVRGAVQEGADIPDTISMAVSNFCMTEGETPVFYTSKAPAADEPLIVRRRVRPVQVLLTTWPAGENTLVWPAEWPPAEEGRYVWALGSRGTVAVRLISMNEIPDNTLANAAMQYDLGCEIQAKALFQSALAMAQLNYPGVISSGGAMLRAAAAIPPLRVGAFLKTVTDG